MTKTATRTMMVSAAAGLIAIMGAMPAAEAKKVHHFIHGPKHVHKWHHFHQPYFVYSGVGDGCSYYWWKWKKTGHPLWKAKYFACLY